MPDRKDHSIQFYLGPVLMIYYAIRSHQRKYEGALPKRIELHPAVMEDFIFHLEKGNSQLVKGNNGELIYLGVSIVDNTHADIPILVSMEDRVEHL